MLRVIFNRSIIETAFYVSTELSSSPCWTSLFIKWFNESNFIFQNIYLFLAAEPPKKRHADLCRWGDAFRWGGSFRFMHQVDRSKLIIIDTQTLRTISHKRQSNYFSFCRIIRPFNRLRTPVITNDILRKLAFWHLGFSLNFFRSTCEPIKHRRSV